MTTEYNQSEQIIWSDESSYTPNTKSESTMESQTQSGMELMLGDIIEISSPDNATYDQNTFFIEYIDDAKIKIVNISTAQKHTLTLYDTGYLTDESIKTIFILSRSDVLGYAKQNGLLPKKWVDIHFGGDIPTIISGEITNLDEDMIEVTTYPDFEVIYINFAYKGLPEHIPILKFHLRERPASVKGSLAEIYAEDKIEQPSEEQASIDFNESGEMSVRVPENPRIDKNYNDILDELYEQSSIIFGEEVEIEIDVEVSKKERRYGLEVQLKDLMDELLSTIPNYKRTPVVIRRITTIVRRFRELREQFSVFDENQNVIGHRNITADYKPIAESLEKLDRQLRWILPVVKHRKKIFDQEFEDESIMNSSIVNDLKSYKSKKNVANVQNKYSAFYSSIDNDFSPFADVDSENRFDVLTNPAQRVAADLEAIVDNLDDYYSYTFGVDLTVNKRRFVIQKYNLGLTRLGEHVMKSGKRVYIREPMTQNDKIAVKSVVLLPNQAVEFSRVDLPGTNIMSKSSLSHNWLYYFKLLNKNTSLKTKIIEDINKEVSYEKKSEDEKYDLPDEQSKFLDSPIDFEISQNVLREEGADFKKLLNSVIPNTRILIQLLRDRATAYNFKDMLDYFEPFMLSADNITYSGRIRNNQYQMNIMEGRGGPYQEIRFHIKTLINEYKKKYYNDRKKYEMLVTKRFDSSGRYQLNPLYKNLFANNEYLKLVLKRYKLEDEEPSKEYRSGSEVLNQILSRDNGAAYSSMVSLMLSFLYTPNLSSMINIEDDGVIKSTSKTCATRVIAKKYTSIRDLQKDNDISEDIYVDKEFDTSPYHIITKYAEDRKKMLATEFVDYLKAVLLDKHDANPATVDELVKTLIAGKKKVIDGNYAMLVEYPQLDKSMDKDELSESDKTSVEIEADAKKKVSYYVRKRGNWTRDEDVDNMNPDILCYTDKKCVVDKKECLSKEDSASHMKKIAQKHAMREYDQTTVEKTMEDMESDLKARALQKIDLLKKTIWLNESRAEQFDYYASNLGKHAVKLEFNVSPYEGLRDLILKQTDFAKKQTDILVFRDKFCREAVINEYSKESQHWLYCVDTNTKLLPTFLYNLAIKYSIGADYNTELDLVCSQIGKLSDDGESIVDRHSGYIIKQIDFMTMDEYDESGFKIVSHEVMGGSAGDSLKEAISNNMGETNYTITNSVKIFENEMTQTVYNITRALCSYINITIEPIESIVLSISVLLLTKNLYSAEKYKKIEELNQKKNVVIPSFQTYRNQNIVFFTTATLFVAIQTMIPSFKPKKTFPGCVFSFGGYPLDGGVEYTTGLKYLSCVIEKITGNIEPWNSIKHLKRDGILKRLMEYISKILNEPEIVDLYTKKREHLVLFPDDEIPQVHNVSKWRSFQPPILPVSVVKHQTAVSNEFKDELSISIKSGHKTQHSQIAIINNKIVQNVYAVVELVNKIVAEGKDALLKAGVIVFLENACCEEKDHRTSIDFFIDKDPNIKKYIDLIAKNTTLLNEIKMLSKAPYITPVAKPLLQLTAAKNIVSEENIYLAFIHYCKLTNSQSLIPDDMTMFFQEKPGGIQPQWDLKQIIDHLKKHGKIFNADSLKILIQTVAKRNIIHGIQMKQIDLEYTRAFSELIDSISNRETPIIEDKLAGYLKSVLEKFDINRPVDKDSVSIGKLKKHLSRVNREMSSQIIEYINMFGISRSASEKNKIRDFLQNLTQWKCDADMLKSNTYVDAGQYTVVQFIRNIVFMITKTIPAFISSSTHEIRKMETLKHWGFSDKHYEVLYNNLNKYYDQINPFKNDKMIVQFFRDISLKMADLNMFLNYIPIFTSFVNEDKLYYLLFDKDALYLLHAYCFYSVLYELVTGSDTDEYLTQEVQMIKSHRKQMREEDIPESEYPDEVDIEMGNRMDFRQRVCGLMIIMIENSMNIKKTIDKPYEQLATKSYNESKREKAVITDYLKNMTIEERRVENIMKQYKMGMWNLGTQKGVFKYDQNLYDLEKEQDKQLYMVPEDQEDFAGEELADYDPNVEADEDAENEANDIGGLDEDYNDGVYYQEDRDE